MNALENLASSLTVAELATRSGRSIDELVAFAMGTKEPSRSLTRRAPIFTPEPKKKTASPSKAVRVGQAVVAAQADTRTPAGRQRYDAAILDALSGGAWMLAQHVRLAAGGSPLQARTALNRLVANGKVTFRGKARATEYQIKGGR